MGLLSSDVPYKGQKFSALKKQALSSGQLFQDPEFPPNIKSITKAGSGYGNVEWKRPNDICPNPKLVVDGISSQDLIQGEVGNCWFVASCCCLAINKVVWSEVIPDLKGQEWDEQHPEKYAGIFHFRFWRFGVWTDVVIDDLLPVRNNKLIFVHSRTKNEFWSALLEKAYAKMYGSYEALDGGELSEALEDFTGGVSQTYDLENERYNEDSVKQEEFFSFLTKEIGEHSLMAAAIPARNKDDMEKPTQMGLVMGHAYAVTAVKKVPMKGTGLFGLFNREKLHMIRLRNPWGGSEWKGAFSDGSEEWSKITSKERSNIGLTFDEDGEFWMTFDDFCKYFVNLAVCHMLNQSIFSLQKRWHENLFNGNWESPNLCGGCINNKESFLNNPQFAFSMPSEEDVIIVLTQKEAKESGQENKTIGFTLLKVEENRRYRVHRLEGIIASSVFRNSRSVFMQRKLSQGRYAVITCTFEPNQTAPFLFRLYTGLNSKGVELKTDKPGKKSLSCLPMNAYPELATRIFIRRGVAFTKKKKVPTATLR